MQYDNQQAIQELLKGIQYMLDGVLKQATKVYDGLITASNGDGTWNIRYNGEVHALKPYGSISPAVGAVVKVIIPQGNQSLAYFM